MAGFICLTLLFLGFGIRHRVFPMSSLEVLNSGAPEFSGNSGGAALAPVRVRDLGCYAVKQSAGVVF